MLVFIYQISYTVIHVVILQLSCFMLSYMANSFVVSKEPLRKNIQYTTCKVLSSPNTNQSLLLYRLIIALLC